jgi:large subunit ribosomal protein L6
MSRVAKNPIKVPSNVVVTIDGSKVTVKGSKGTLCHQLSTLVNINYADNNIQMVLVKETDAADAEAGTTRAIVNNMVHGVTEGFSRKLELVGVGYRAQVQGDKLNLTLGYSHPIVYEIPEGITTETPSQTEIIIKGLDKQLVGQVAAKIRAYRSPEHYKGKGIRFSDEKIKLKEVKKK